MLNSKFFFIFLIFMPVIISESSWNHTEVMGIVNSIPKEYYRFVERVDFVNEPIFFRNQYIDGLARAEWTDDTHYCTNAKVWVYGKEDAQTILLHELGHIYEFCVLKRDTSTEEFANGFPHNI